MEAKHTAEIDMDIREVIGIDNPSALKFWAMGFIMREVQVRQLHHGPNVSAIRGRFQCVCGREEVFQQTFNDSDIEISDAARTGSNIYRALDRFGSMGRQHLIGDGYDPALVDEMIMRGGNEALGAAVAFAAMRYMEFQGQSVAYLPPTFDHRVIYAMALEHFKGNMPRPNHRVMRPMHPVYDPFPVRF